MLMKCKAVVDHSVIPPFPCIHVADKDGTKNNLATRAKFLDQELAQNWIVPIHLLKPTFSENRTHNKIGYGQNCFGPKRGYSVYAGSSSTGDEKETIVVTNIQETKAPEWSSPITCSNSPLSEANNMSKCECTKDQAENQQKKFQCIGIYWVLVSLAVTVLWGKINVIILLPLFLCFFPLWNASCCWIKGIPKLWDAESKVYKKSHRDRTGRSCRNKELLQWAWNLLAKILVFVLEGFL